MSCRVPPGPDHKRLVLSGLLAQLAYRCKSCCWADPTLVENPNFASPNAGRLKITEPFTLSPQLWETGKQLWRATVAWGEWCSGNACLSPLPVACPGVPGSHVRQGASFVGGYNPVRCTQMKQLSFNVLGASFSFEIQTYDGFSPLGRG